MPCGAEAQCGAEAHSQRPVVQSLVCHNCLCSSCLRGRLSACAKASVSSASSSYPKLMYRLRAGELSATTCTYRCSTPVGQQAEGSQGGCVLSTTLAALLLGSPHQCGSATGMIQCCSMFASPTRMLAARCTTDMLRRQANDSLFVPIASQARCSRQNPLHSAAA